MFNCLLPNCIYHKILRSPLPFILICIVALNFLIFSWQKTLIRQRQSNLLVDNPSKNITVGSDMPNWDKSVGENIEQYLPYIPDATKNPLVILAGMSQMYAINDTKPGDKEGMSTKYAVSNAKEGEKIIVEHIDDALVHHGMRAFGLAAPNMHNEEGLLLLMTTLSNKKTCPKFFIYGVCFDKFRNIDLRPGMQRLLSTKPELTRSWRETAVKYRELYPKASEKMLASLISAESSRKQEQVTVEERLRKQAAKLVPLVAARQDINAFIMMNLFELRNWVFNISPQSKRPILQTRYDLNKQFLQMLADVAMQNGVQPIFYIIPLNPLANTPYIHEQYAVFKQWLQQLCLQKKIPFANLEDVVLPQYWGEFMGGPDFKHFSAEGHAITAKAILKEFGPLILGAKVMQ